MNQRYKVSVRYAGANQFVPAPKCYVNYQPIRGANIAAATKVVITRPGGMVFRKINAIRFTFLKTVSDNSGGATYREIDVEGSPSS